MTWSVSRHANPAVELSVSASDSGTRQEQLSSNQNLTLRGFTCYGYLTTAQTTEIMKELRSVHGRFKVLTAVTIKNNVF
jgi:hypothetical protein